MKPSEIAIRRARVADEIETPELPTRLEDRPLDARTITIYEFVDSMGDARVPDRPYERGNTVEARAILGLTKEGLYGLDLPYKIIDGQRHYDLAAVREHAKRTRLPNDCVRASDAAKIVGVSPATITRWARAGLIHAIEVNGMRAYRVSDLRRISK